MTPSKTFSYREVETIPHDLEPGVLYHAARYRIAVHLCACGCGYQVPTALAPNRWRLSVHNGRPTLMPSIGNGSFSCRSHYFITRGRVRWTGQYTAEMIARARQADNPRAHPTLPRRHPRSAWEKFASWIRGLFRS